MTTESLGNDPDRLSWFRELGFGLFVHWSVDAQLGPVISHSMVGASDAYLDRYINDLPEMFNPKRFDPESWALTAKAAGIRYIVFTAKHHNGFAMWDTDTTEFNVSNTPYGQDIVREVIEAFREHDIAVGLYFSPDDFWLLRQQGQEISRDRDAVQPSNNEELMAHNKAQLRELLTEYGPIDTLFLDGDPAGLRELAWELQPEIVITRGEMETPEQRVPGEASDNVWEGNMTIGTQWSYKPSNERYKSATELIENLIETRAKGGNFLLNVSPRPDGSIPDPQEDRLRAIGLWNFVNHDAIYDITPCPTIREGDILFTRASTNEPTTVYACVTNTHWPMNPEPRTFSFESVQATDETEVGILGQSGEVFEYRPDIDPVATWAQEDGRLYVAVTHSHRLYNPDTYDDVPDDVRWPHPVVIQITNAMTVGSE